jgi:DNA-binding CsgD family transcriptional regulator
MEHNDEFEASLARAAQELGQQGFHQRLLELAGSIVGHDSGWIVRYDAASTPDVLFTKAIPSSIVEYYLDAEPHKGDPYFCSWRRNASARIETLADALPMAVDRDFYDRDFMRRAEFSDELALYLPSFGSACLSIFFELRDGRFGPYELRRLQALFPTLLGLHEAHLRLLFSDLASVCNSSKNNAFILLDRARAPIFSTTSWRHAEECMPKLKRAADCKISCGCNSCSFEDMNLQTIELDDFNAIAPGGYLVYLGDGPNAESQYEEQQTMEIIERLTPRERDILFLTLEGHSTGVIAQRLALAKGYIKNCRLRMYKKFNVSSERGMIALLNPHVAKVRQNKSRFTDM